MRYHNPQQKSTGGFALLMTMIVVSVVLSIGLTVLDLSIKQVRLTTNSRDSEIAFHAANAGLECARYWRLQLAGQLERGASVAPTNNCFNGTFSGLTASTAMEPTNQINRGQSFRYNWEYTWGTNNDRCSVITMLVASTTPTGGGLTTTGMLAAFPGYIDNDHACPASSRCSVISVQGFNRPCATRTTSGTVSREVLLEF